MVEMTAQEKLNRAMAVDNMYYLFKKYYPVWVEKKQREAEGSAES